MTAADEAHAAAAEVERRMAAQLAEARTTIERVFKPTHDAVRAHMAERTAELKELQGLQFLPLPGQRHG